ncbi:SH3 domain-containing protein [Metabacillus sp. RGM 3146]|uniref:SH3 domain-containing protein n=1 Tax=Metabacillus sp. RGM 3146 TaxID=3401092 RepID=UPI003B99AF74
MIKKGLTILACTAIMAAAAPEMPVKVHAVSKEAIVSADHLNIRSGPGLGYPAKLHAKKGDRFEILNREGDWLKVLLPGNRSGWAANWLVNVESSKKTKASVISDADGLRMRTGPGTNYSVAGTFPMGEKASVLDMNGSWVKVSYNGLEGWILSDYIRSSSVKGAYTENSVQNENKTGTVTVPTLNVRDTYSINGRIIDTIASGTEVTILEEQGSWSKISYGSGQTGWTSSQYMQGSGNGESNSTDQKQSLSIRNDGTNIRSLPSTSSSVIASANEGESYTIIQKEGDWYKITLTDGRTGYVAGWLTDTLGNDSGSAGQHSRHSLRNKTIVIDPGHGGYDSGTIGYNGTLEKSVTLETATLLYNKLRAAGANVIMTRSTDTYVSLQSRVETSDANRADAFVSMHYDSTLDSSVKGFTCYYYNTEKDQALAEAVHSELASQSPSSDRGIRFGNFHVLRENHEPSILLELGYLSNSTEEMILSSDQYQEQAAQSVFEGLNDYFK